MDLLWLLLSLFAFSGVFPGVIRPFPDQSLRDDGASHDGVAEGDPLAGASEELTTGETADAEAGLLGEEAQADVDGPLAGVLGMDAGQGVAPEAGAAALAPVTDVVSEVPQEVALTLEAEAEGEAVWVEENIDGAIEVAEIEDFTVGEDVLFVTLAEEGDEATLEVTPSEDEADAVVMARGEIIAVLKGAPRASAADIMLSSLRL